MRPKISHSALTHSAATAQYFNAYPASKYSPVQIHEDKTTDITYQLGSILLSEKLVHTHMQSCRNAD